MASPPQELFTIPIAPVESHPGGSIVCTSPAPQVYLLTWTSPPDNRLTPAFCASLLRALDTLELSYAPGVVVTCSGVAKFYSNGLDLGLAVRTAGFWDECLYAVFRRLLTYPMPTVALVGGHAFAGGLMLAMHHDYRVFTAGGGARRRAFVCVNELEFGAPLLPPMSAIFRLKLAPAAYRDLVLEARRFDAPAALHAGIVDAVGELDDALRMIAERGLVKKGATGVYGVLKAEMYRESLALLSVKETATLGGWKDGEKKRKEEAAKRLQSWKESEAGKAKL
ncbi:enoyl-CoA hydratase/isomerase family protein [Biscogniauxia sp. FL1348]|nr:enoyl-CoA hydratase/isomerase family protein [Biscogniauxia sp. FL1348]